MNGGKMDVVIERGAFRSPEIKGHIIEAWYLKEPSGDCLVKITKGDVVVREFLYPAYKVYNLSAHAEEIIQSEIDKDADGYRCAGSDGLGGGVMPRPVSE
jgi:hypothetical protein